MNHIHFRMGSLLHCKGKEFVVKGCVHCSIFSSPADTLIFVFFRTQKTIKAKWCKWYFIGVCSGAPRWRRALERAWACVAPNLRNCGNLPIQCKITQSTGMATQMQLEASETQREKERQRARARDKKETFLVGRTTWTTTWKFCSGG